MASKNLTTRMTMMMNKQQKNISLLHATFALAVDSFLAFFASQKAYSHRSFPNVMEKEMEVPSLMKNEIFKYSDNSLGILVPKSIVKELEFDMNENYAK